MREREKYMTLRHIEIFTVVCQEGSVTKAADRLHISQPTVSVAIKEFENHYGGTLFERISHKLYLTPFGQKIYDHSMNLLNLYSDLAEARQDYEVVRVGTGTAIGKFVLPKVVKEFEKEHPDVHVHATVGDASRMYRLIMQNHADFVIAENIDDIYGLAHKCIQQYPIVALCHRDNPLANKRYVSAEELARQNLLLREPSSRTRQLIDLYFQNHDIDISPTWESYSVQTLINATAENLGVSFHSLDHAVAYQTPELTILKLEEFNGERQVNIGYNKNKIISPNMQDFLNCYLKMSKALVKEGIAKYNYLHPEMPIEYEDKNTNHDFF